MYISIIIKCKFCKLIKFFEYVWKFTKNRSKYVWKIAKNALQNVWIFAKINMNYVWIFAGC